MLVPPPQLVLQAPAEQRWPSGQALPQVPQLVESVITSAQAAPQAAKPVAQPQTPLLQVWPAPQALPQAPQLAGSTFVAVQLDPHMANGVGQLLDEVQPEISTTNATASSLLIAWPPYVEIRSGHRRLFS
jgi:hypothetical protein